jgi:hypothetical protein
VKPQLSVVCLGHVHNEAIEPLTAHLNRLEQVVTNLSPQISLAQSRAELNRAVDAAANDWIVIMRERETVDDALASEIADAISDSRAWGYRIATTPIYAGRPLRVDGDGELRLFHRRHLLRRGELQVEGSVVRMSNALHALTFDSVASHRAYLEKNASRRSLLMRTLVFLRTARTLDTNTLRYLWIEAGYASR